MTSVGNYFAGGDLVNRSRTVVDAIRSAKLAAIGIDCFLEGIEFGMVEGVIRVGGNGGISFGRYLDFRKGKDLKPVPDGITQFESINLDYFDSVRSVQPQQIPVSKRLNVDGLNTEIKLGLDRKIAMSEAERCFHCGTCIDCENCWLFCPEAAITREDKEGRYITDLDFCKGCGLCVQECPRDAMQMVKE
jgi:2-oxoacid:acceptor oxidoreductase delta subunit (pyruvate/2-ketoisovalerate family)